MQVSVENLGKLERKLTIRVPADQYESQVKARLAEVARSVRLKGFRPGKIPPKVIEQRFGPQVRGEAISELIRNSFNEAVGKENLRPAMAPEIDTTGQPSDGQIEYTARFEVLPEVGAIDVSQLEINKATASVSDADVDAMIETLRAQRRDWAPVERAAQAGDMALFEYSAQGSDASGSFRHPAEGADRVGTIIGSGAMTTGIEDALIGHATGDTVNVDVDFPADFREPMLAGRHARVEARLIRIQESKLPEVDEAFIRAFGIAEGGIEKFRSDVRANLERELKGMLSARLKNEVVGKLVDAYPQIELPRGMIEREAQMLAQQAQEQAKQQGQSAPGAEAYTEIARRRVAAGVLVGEIARANDIRLDNRRVAETLASFASTYEEPERVVELYQRDPQLMGGLQSRVMEDQVADWIADHAKVTEQALSFGEAMRPS
ncbi:MAG: trigger factor [Proteobacteria bacterium]|uniref:trigger factor n=1 Tax=Rudaea sp. TaxID=2136325 RepID=UPI001D94DD94|nr:trigger factor [Pseudomonadota bacterium]MBS0567243.1 trigger factor [Pseudomonadota bacterium]